MTKIDEDTRIKLIGLKAVANDLLKQMKAVQHAVASLTGDDDWSGDFVFDEKITVEDLWEATAGIRERAKKND